MARRYDSRTTIFSPEGRLYQVEYAMKAISQGGSAIGILANDGIVLAAEKRVTSDLLDIRSSSEKMYMIDDHIACGAAGITADANILIQYARRAAQSHYLQFKESIPVEKLLWQVCNLKQGYTQYGGQRPFGVSFLFAGWDHHFGFQLFQSDPSGNYCGWRAQAIGANHLTAQNIFKDEYKEGQMTLQDSLKLAIKVLAKTMDTTKPSPEKLEFVTVTRKGGKVVYHMLTKEELEKLIEESQEILKEGRDEDDEEEESGDI